MKIKAAVTRAPQAPMTIEELDIESPRAGEILVRVVATGICHTDLVARDKYVPTPQPVVLGHEGAGIVEQVGTGVSKVKPGDHVVMTFNSCGQCPSCIDHASTYCYQFFPYNFLSTRTDGSTALSKSGEVIYSNFFGQSSFANFALCHERNIVKVPNDVPLKLLGPLACGIQTGAGAIINALKVGFGQSVAVFGTGSVGLSAIMAAKASGAGTIIAVDTVQSRLDFALGVGATHAFNAKTSNVSEQIMQITGHGLNYALDTTGNTTVIRTALMSLAHRGTCGVLGVSPPGSDIAVDASHFMSGGRRLIGIVEGEANPDVFIPALIELYRQGRFPFDKLMRFYSLEQINEAIHDSEQGLTIKPVLVM